MSKDRRLGRGLAALLGTPTDEVTEGSASNNGSPSNNAPVSKPRIAPQIVDAPPTSRQKTIFDAEEANDEGPGELMLDVYEIDDNPFQPRREFSESEIASLSESLKEHDMLQPILVRQIGSRYQLISGERRLRAAIQAGWSKIPARLREADDRLVAELAIVENLQRQDLNPIEKALSFRRYLEEHGAKQDELAQRLKIDRSTVANLMRLLDLPETVQSRLNEGKISAGHARALLPLGDEDLQREFCSSIVVDGWSVRETEKQVSARIEREDGNPLTGKTSSAKKKKRVASAQIVALEQDLRNALGTKVDLKQTSRGSGKITIHFKSAAEYERIHSYLMDEEVVEGKRAA